jgi:hypothetical protein
VTCDEIRDVLAEHRLGTLGPEEDQRVREHLRGCASCRAEAATLDEGVGSFARASHDREPPAELRDRVVRVLAEEWDAAPAARSRAPGRRPSRATLVAAAALVAALAWAGAASVIAHRNGVAASKYESFLEVLGGDNVRVGELEAAGPQSLEGSVVIYDSHVGQSWVLVLARAPGRSGEANVTMRTPSGRTIDLHPMEFGGGGEASTWLVTPADLGGFEQVNLWDEGGLIASATVERA